MSDKQHEEIYKFLMVMTPRTWKIHYFRNICEEEMRKLDSD
jgi:hypothetical protein